MGFFRQRAEDAQHFHEARMAHVEGDYARGAVHMSKLRSSRLKRRAYRDAAQRAEENNSGEHVWFFGLNGGMSREQIGEAWKRIRSRRKGAIPDFL